MTPGIPIGISSYTYRWAMSGGHLDAWRLIDRAAAQGLQVLQILDNVPLDRWADDDLRALRRAAEGRLSLQVGTSGLDGTRLARYVEVAKLCGARVVRATLTEDPGAAYEVLREILPALRASDVTVALENHFTQPSDAIVGLLRRIEDPHVAVCLDTLNSISLLESPAETVAKLAPYAVCVHLKDGLTRREGTGVRVAGTALGEGLLDLPALLRVVWAGGRRPPMLVELWQDREADEATTLAAEEAWVERSIAFARRLAELAPR